MKKNIIYISVILFAIFFSACGGDEESTSQKDTTKKQEEEIVHIAEIINSTFLGNEKRNFYGKDAPDTLVELWKIELGTGKTRVGSTVKAWSGAGWTGQPLMVKEDSGTYIIQGTYSHNLLKINAETGKVIWKYDCGDVIKGTGSIYYNPKAKKHDEKIIILQGSRLGFGNSSHQKVIPSYRAVSYFTGKKLWEYNSVRTESYSRDVDASAVIHNDTAYIGLENGFFMVFDPNPQNAKELDGIVQPKVLEIHKTYNDSDKKRHGGNLVTESSPSYNNNRVYISSGSGRILSYNTKTKRIDRNFYTGSDIDGTPVVTDDGCILVGIEREYIPGKGGVFKLDFSKSDDSTAVKWFFPTENRHYVFWDGGIIGSSTTNEYYRKKNDKIPSLTAFSAIDGYLYVVKTNKVTGKKVLGPNKKYKYDTPELVFKYRIGESISTPLFVDNKIIAACYQGIYLFEFDENLNFKLKGHINVGSIEATPFVYNKKVYIAARNGYFYCFGNKKEELVQ